MRDSKTIPIRILHVLKGMDRGGIETWLMHVLRNVDRERFQFDFLTNTTEPCAYDGELRKMGCRIIPCLEPHRPWRYAWNFWRLLLKHGPYDVVHSHVHHYSGFVCWLAKKAGIQMIIAHSHNDTTPVEAKAGVLRRMYLSTMEWMIEKNATHGLACSSKAAYSLFGERWHSDPRWRVLYYGLDLKPFSASIDKIEVRSEFGIPSDAFVVGHVGRFSNQKNHTFLLDIIAAALVKDSECYALLVGDGPLRFAMEEKARRLGIENRVIFAGLRSDIPRVMQGGMDVFVLPSLYEGLGLVLIEAQAAGLPCFISEGLPDEADVVKEIVSRLSLADGPEKWAERITEARICKNQLQKDLALKKLKNCPFNIIESIRQLETFYAG